MNSIRFLALVALATILATPGHAQGFPTAGWGNFTGEGIENGMKNVFGFFNPFYDSPHEIAVRHEREFALAQAARRQQEAQRKLQAERTAVAQARQQQVPRSVYEMARMGAYPDMLRADSYNHAYTAHVADQTRDQLDFLAATTLGSRTGMYGRDLPQDWTPGYSPGAFEHNYQGSGQPPTYTFQDPRQEPGYGRLRARIPDEQFALLGLVPGQVYTQDQVQTFGRDMGNTLRAMAAQPGPQGLPPITRGTSRSIYDQHAYLGNSLMQGDFAHRNDPANPSWIQRINSYRGGADPILTAPDDLAGRLGYLQRAGLEMPRLPVMPGANPGAPGPDGEGPPMPEVGGFVPQGPVQATVPAGGAPVDDTVPSRSLF